jgi:hypothetical protein
VKNGIYVERQLRETTEEVHPPVIRHLLADDSLTWEGLLGSGDAPIVLLAPATAGKSMELEHAADACRDRHQLAVLAEARHLLRGVAGNLDPESTDAFVKWRKTADEMLFLFIDAVDELHREHKALRDLLWQLQRDLAPFPCRVRLILSARNGAWTASNTAALDELSKEITGRSENEEADRPRLLTFAPLSEAAIRALAAAEGVSDAEAFMRAYKEREIDALADVWPSGVKILVARWKATPTFGSWTDCLDALIEGVGGEARVELAREGELTPDERRRGLQRMAAATQLMQRPDVASPLFPLPGDMVSSKRIFDDWPTSKVSELLQHPLFLPRGEDAAAVQLSPGLPAVPQFLAARWLAERIRSGSSAKQVLDLLAARVFQEERVRFPGWLRSVAGWVSSEIPAFRELILDEHPEIVLFEGDPDHLSDDDIRRALDSYCRNVISNRAPPGFPSPGTTRALARPGVEGSVCALLSEHEAIDKVQERLLPLVIAGRYRSCLDHALRLAGARDRGLLSRARAIQAAAAIDSAAAAPELLGLTHDPEPQIRDELMKVLVPSHLRGEGLVAFVVAGGGLRDALADVAPHLELGELDALLEAVVPRVDPDVSSQSTEDAFEAVIPLLVERVRRNRKPAPAIVLDGLIRVERTIHQQPVHHELVGEERRSLDRSVNADDELRRRLWLARFQAAEASVGPATSGLGRPAFGDLLDRDILWLASLVGAQGDLARHVFFRIWDRLSDHGRAVVLEDAELPIGVRSDITDHERYRREAGARELKKRVARDAEDTETRKKNELELRPRLADIESGKDLAVLRWAFRAIRERKSSSSTPATRSSFDLGTLEARVGSDLAASVVRGLKAFWRQEPGGEVPISDAATVALTGLTMAVQDGLVFAELSAAEAELAARYSLFAPAAFPFWVDDLVGAHPEVVHRVLDEALAREWSDTSGSAGVMHLVSGATPRVSALVRDIVLGLLEGGSPAAPTTSRTAVRVLLTTSGDAVRLAVLAHREVEQGGRDDEELAHWLRLWAHFDPAAAARWAFRAQGREHGFPKTLVLERAMAHLANDLEGVFDRQVESVLSTPDGLATWIRALLAQSQPRKTNGDVREDSRERLLQRCQSLLASNVSRAAHDRLRALAEDPSLVAFRRGVIWLVEHQLQAAAETNARRWVEEDILGVERGDEKQPRDLGELFTMVKRHLTEVGQLLDEKEDFAYGELFDGVDEPPIQRWVASCLQTRARHLYSVVRENMVARSKEVDISAFVPGLGFVPIEIKPLKYTKRQLMCHIERQLLGLYMKTSDRRYGVFLLFLQPGKGQKKWRNRGTRDALLHNLQVHANKVAGALGKMIHVAVIDAHTEVPESIAMVIQRPVSKGRAARGGGGRRRSDRTTVTKREVRRDHR